MTDLMTGAPDPYGDPLRDLRPELTADNRDHMAYVLSSASAYQAVADRLIAKKAMHRLSFLTAAALCAEQMPCYFLDIRQNAEPVPYPEDGERFCAILGDREIEGPRPKGVRFSAINGPIGDVKLFRQNTAVARGPSFYHQTSLRALLAQCRRVTVDSTGYGWAPLYASACEPTAKEGRSSLLIETTPAMARAWMNVVSHHTTDCAYKLFESGEDIGAIRH